VKKKFNRKIFSKVTNNNVIVSQGSVAICAGCGGIFDICLTANLSRNLVVKKNLKSVKN